MVSRHQRARAQVTEEMVDAFMELRLSKTRRLDIFVDLLCHTEVAG